MAVATLEPQSHTLHDFSESSLSSYLTEHVLANDKLSLKYQALKIDKHVIQNRSMRQRNHG